MSHSMQTPYEKERIAANAQHQWEWQSSPSYYEPPWEPTAQERVGAERQAAEFRAAHPAPELEAGS